MKTMRVTRTPYSEVNTEYWAKQPLIRAFLILDESDR